MKANNKLLNQFKEIVTRSGLEVETFRRVLADFREQLWIQEAILHARLTKHIEQWGWECQAIWIKIDLNKLIVKINGRIPLRFICLRLTRFIHLRLTPTHLRILTLRIEVLQPLGGRAPPPLAIFVPIPHKTEQGSCARSDLPADSAY